MAPPDSSGPLATLYVGDLHPDVTEVQLQEKFSPFGMIAMIHVCRDSVTRKSLGYAYVNYYTHNDAQQALEKLNYTDIKGRCCRIMWNKKERQTVVNADANIFVKNLDPNIDSRALYDTFNIFGNIISCKVATDQSGASKGYGFVQYESEDAARQAIERVNNMMIGGRKVFVGPFIKREQNDLHKGGDGSLYVRNIPGDWDDDKVVELFAPFGEVASSLVCSDSRSGKRYAFINFKDAESANKARETLHGKDLRTDEEKAAMEEEEKKKKEEEESKEEGEKAAKPEGEAAEGGEDEAKEKRLPAYCLLVSASKSKAERDAEMKKRQDNKPPEREGIKLYIRNLPKDMNDEGLKSLFTDFGTVTDIKAVLDKESGECRGYGFVRYATMEEATAAVTAMHLKEAIPGQPPLHVGLAGGKGGEKGGKGDGKGKGKGKGCGKGCGYGGGKGMGFGYMPGQMPGMYPGQPYPMMPMQGMPGQMMQRPPMPAMGPYGHPMQMMRPNMMPPYPQRPGMPGMPMPGAMPMAMPGQPPMPGQPAAAPAPGQITAASLAGMPPHARKQMFGEKLYPMITRFEPQMAGKITGMLLEMEDAELLVLLESEPTLRSKVGEAVNVLKRAGG